MKFDSRAGLDTSPRSDRRGVSTGEGPSAAEVVGDDYIAERDTFSAATL